MFELHDRVVALIENQEHTGELTFIDEKSILPDRYLVRLDDVPEGWEEEQWVEENQLRIDDRGAVSPDQMQLPLDIDDKVNSPKHYTNGKIEVIELLFLSLTDEEFKGYLKGNITKYLSRYENKGGAEDLAKAEKYLGFLQRFTRGWNE